ncbi:GLPGLI family protein [Winogradskyella psychrotolerans]|uniref:GLPGLI family protein n=1 Tax=Winogradskyella psychrotolerans TaxID=1344585 RepID=UPI001C07D2A7|nr:GLPGLI family protein [Winogradskyella psychrotolerans]MBU2929794.1 GLPGLI family protein [Winogradskyella psychrotolerans]
MLKKSFVLFITILSAFSYCQNDEKLTQVSYTFNLNLNSYSEGLPYKSKLYYNDSTSLFVYDNVHLEEAEGFRRFVKDRTGRINGISHFGNYDKIGNRFYLDIDNKELTSRQLYGYYINIVSEKNIDFNWQITEETKNIGEYLCYKATTENFRGRNYEVWFTYEIPVSTGPWKFHGLPGLILEVHDDKDLVNITFEDISTSTQEYVDFEKPYSENPYTLEIYLQECFRLYLLFIDRQKDAIIQGSIRSDMNHPSYVNLEYNDEQIQLLNQYHQIDYKDYERSNEFKD